MLRPKPQIQGSLERWIIGKLHREGYQSICEFIKEALMEKKAREKEQIVQMHMEHYDKMSEEERKEVQLRR